MNEPKFEAKRIRRSYRQTIAAAPEVVFPLLCPVREAEWQDGWQYEMIYSNSGLVEEGAVFNTPHAGEEPTTWIVTKHDPKAHVVDFTRFTPNSKTCVLTITVSPKDELNSFVDICYTYTAISPAGNEFIDSYTEEVFLEGVVFWEKSLNHFIKTGVKLTEEEYHLHH